jgi:hypothetical protein
MMAKFEPKRRRNLGVSNKTAVIPILLGSPESDEDLTDQAGLAADWKKPKKAPHAPSGTKWTERHEGFSLRLPGRRHLGLSKRAQTDW